MPTLAANEIMRVCFYCQEGDQGSVNTLYYVGTTPTGSSATYEDFATLLGTYYPSLIKPLLNNGAAYDGLSVQNVNTLPVYTRTFKTTGAGQGTAGVDALPRQTSGLLSLYTLLAGPRMRGRLYLPFPAVADNGTNGTPITGYVTKLTNLGNAIAAPLNVIGSGGSIVMVPVIYHRATVTPPRPESTTPIFSTVSRTKWATHRSRGSYGRPNASPV